MLSKDCFDVSLLKSFNALRNYDFIFLSETVFPQISPSPSVSKQVNTQVSFTITKMNSINKKIYIALSNKQVEQMGINRNTQKIQSLNLTRSPVSIMTAVIIDNKYKNSNSNNNDY